MGYLLARHLLFQLDDPPASMRLLNMVAYATSPGAFAGKYISGGRRGLCAGGARGQTFQAVLFRAGGGGGGWYELHVRFASASGEAAAGAAGGVHVFKVRITARGDISSGRSAEGWRIRGTLHESKLQLLAFVSRH